MDSVALIVGVRNYWSNDPIIQSLLGVSNSSGALRRILSRSTSYASLQGGYQYPGIALTVNDEEVIESINTNNIELCAELISSVKIKDSSMTLVKLKDRLKSITVNKTNVDNNHVIINNQAQALGYYPKIRGIFWVGGSPIIYKEMGTERLHILECTFKMILGD